MPDTWFNHNKNKTHYIVRSFSPEIPVTIYHVGGDQI